MAEPQYDTCTIELTRFSLPTICYVKGYTEFLVTTGRLDRELVDPITVFQNYVVVELTSGPAIAEAFKTTMGIGTSIEVEIQTEVIDEYVEAIERIVDELEGGDNVTPYESVLMFAKDWE